MNAFAFVLGGILTGWGLRGISDKIEAWRRGRPGGDGQK